MKQVCLQSPCYLHSKTRPNGKYLRQGKSNKNTMVVYHWRSSSIKGRLPSKVIFHQRLSSTKGRLPSKVDLLFGFGYSFWKDVYFPNPLSIKLYRKSAFTAELQFSRSSHRHHDHMNSCMAIIAILLILANMTWHIIVREGTLPNRVWIVWSSGTWW